MNVSGLREADKKLKEVTKDAVKIVEKAGTKLRFLLHKSNPFDNGTTKCERTSCLIFDNPLNKKYRCEGSYVTVCWACEEEAQKKANAEKGPAPHNIILRSIKCHPNQMTNHYSNLTADSQAARAGNSS